jgi:hypothetical protein
VEEIRSGESIQDHHLEPQRQIWPEFRNPERAIPFTVNSEREE